MTISATKRLDSRVVSNGTNGGSGDFTSGTFTTVADSLLVAVVLINAQLLTALVQSEVPTPQTDSANWTKVGAAFNTGRQFTAHVFVYVKDNSTSGSTKTFAMSGASTWDTAPNSIDVVLFELTGAKAQVDQTQALGTATSTSDTARDPGAQSVTLAVAADATSWVVGGYASDCNSATSTTSPGSGWTEEAEHASGATQNFLHSEVQSFIGLTSTTVPWADLDSGTNTFDYALAAWEVLAAAAGEPPSVMFLGPTRSGMTLA